MLDYSEPKVPEVTADTVKNAIDSNEMVTILDVRTEGEVARGKVEGSVNIPIDEVSKKVEQVIPDKQSKIFVYCLSGSRSVFAVDQMIKLGYKNVFNLTNGILVWRARNYPWVKIYD